MKHIIRQDALKELIESGSAPFRTTNRSYILYCPHCGKNKLYVDKSTGTAVCFRCGTPPQLASSALASVYHLSSRELYEQLYGGGNYSDLNDLEELVFPWHEEEEEPLPWAPDYPPEMHYSPEWVDITHPLAQPGRDYLQKRGVSLDLAQEYGLGWMAPEHRVTFPVVVGGLLLGWQARHVGNLLYRTSNNEFRELPKIKTTGAVKARCLMFQDRIRDGHVVLSEGPVDAMKAHACGGNVASMGKSLSDQQKQIILHSGASRLYIGLDRDASKEVGELVAYFSPHMETYRLLPPPHRGDLGECTLDEVRAQFDCAPKLRLEPVIDDYLPLPKRWL